MQVFRGFFEGRYLFDSVTGFLRYASPAAPGGFGPLTRRLLGRLLRDAADGCPAGTTPTGGPLLFYLQSSSPDGIARDAAGASDINNEEFALFVQDKWQAGHGLTLDYGLRWDAQMHAGHGRSDDDGVRAVPERSAVPVGRHDSEPVEAVPAARRRSPGTSARTASRSCAAAPASTTPARTC